MKSVAAIAKENGWEVVHHASGFFFVDLDSLAALHRFEVEVDRLMEAVPELVRGRYVARSPGGNWHGYVYGAGSFGAPGALYVLLHLLLGSDLEHERLALARLESAVSEPPFCFFEESEQAAASRAWMAGIREAVRVEEEEVVGAQRGEYAGVTVHFLKNGVTHTVVGCKCARCVALRPAGDDE